MHNSHQQLVQRMQHKSERPSNALLIMRMQLARQAADWMMQPVRDVATRQVGQHEALQPSHSSAQDSDPATVSFDTPLQRQSVLPTHAAETIAQNQTRQAVQRQPNNLQPTQQASVQRTFSTSTAANTGSPAEQSQQALQRQPVMQAQVVSPAAKTQSAQPVQRAAIAPIQVSPPVFQNQSTQTVQQQPNHLTQSAAFSTGQNIDSTTETVDQSVQRQPMAQAASPVALEAVQRQIISPTSDSEQAHIQRAFSAELNTASPITQPHQPIQRQPIAQAKAALPVAQTQSTQAIQRQTALPTQVASPVSQTQSAQAVQRQPNNLSSTQPTPSPTIQNSGSPATSFHQSVQRQPVAPARSASSISQNRAVETVQRQAVSSTGETRQTGVQHAYSGIQNTAVPTAQSAQPLQRQPVVPAQPAPPVTQNQSVHAVQPTAASPTHLATPVSHTQAGASQVNRAVVSAPALSNVEGQTGIHSSGSGVSGFPNPETQSYTDEMRSDQSVPVASSVVPTQQVGVQRTFSTAANTGSSTEQSQQTLQRQPVVQAQTVSTVAKTQSARPIQRTDLGTQNQASRAQSAIAAPQHQVGASQIGRAVASTPALSNAEGKAGLHSSGLGVSGFPNPETQSTDPTRQVGVQRTFSTAANTGSPIEQSQQALQRQPVVRAQVVSPAAKTQSAQPIQREAIAPTQVSSPDFQNLATQKTVQRQPDQPTQSADFSTVQSINPTTETVDQAVQRQPMAQAASPVALGEAAQRQAVSPTSIPQQARIQRAFSAEQNTASPAAQPHQPIQRQPIAQAALPVAQNQSTQAVQRQPALPTQVASPVSHTQSAQAVQRQANNLSSTRPTASPTIQNSGSPATSFHQSVQRQPVMPAQSASSISQSRAVGAVQRQAVSSTGETRQIDVQHAYSGIQNTAVPTAQSAQPLQRQPAVPTQATLPVTQNQSVHAVQRTTASPTHLATPVSHTQSGASQINRAVVPAPALSNAEGMTGLHSSGLGVSGFPNPETQFHAGEMHANQSGSAVQRQADNFSSTQQNSGENAVSVDPSLQRQPVVQAQTAVPTAQNQPVQAIQRQAISPTQLTPPAVQTQPSQAVQRQPIVQARAVSPVAQTQSAHAVHRTEAAIQNQTAQAVSPAQLTTPVAQHQAVQRQPDNAVSSTAHPATQAVTTNQLPQPHSEQQAQAVSPVAQNQAVQRRESADSSTATTGNESADEALHRMAQSPASPQRHNEDARLSTILRRHRKAEAETNGAYKIYTPEKPSMLSGKEYEERLQRKADLALRRKNERLRQLSPQEKAKIVQRKRAAHQKRMEREAQAAVQRKEAVQQSQPPVVQPDSDELAVSQVQRVESGDVANADLPEVAQVQRKARNGDALQRNSAEQSAADSAVVKQILRSTATKEKTDSSVEFVAPSQPRPMRKQRNKRTVRREVSADVQRNAPQQVETEIGALPADLWGLMDEPVPGSEAKQSVDSMNKTTVQRAAGHVEAGQPPVPTQHTRGTADQSTDIGFQDIEAPKRAAAGEPVGSSDSGATEGRVQRTVNLDAQGQTVLRSEDGRQSTSHPNTGFRDFQIPKHATGEEPVGLSNSGVIEGRVQRAANLDAQGQAVMRSEHSDRAMTQSADTVRRDLEIPKHETEKGQVGSSNSGAIEGRVQRVANLDAQGQAVMRSEHGDRAMTQSADTGFRDMETPKHGTGDVRVKSGGLLADNENIQRAAGSGQSGGAIAQAKSMNRVMRAIAAAESAPTQRVVQKKTMVSPPVPNGAAS